MKKGILISLEGPDGAGKTTVMTALATHLREAGHEVVTTREPGGVAVSEQIRTLILDPAHTTMDDKTELLLYIAARRQHLVERILPALAAGQVILLDRFIDSSVAYQGGGRGLDKAEISWLNHYATDGLQPDLTLLFDVPAEVGLARIAANRGNMDRMEQATHAMHDRVRATYLEIADETQRMVKIDASRDFETVLTEALAVLAERLCL